VEEGVRKAREAIDRALVLQPDLVQAHTALAYIKMTHDWDWAGAEASFRRARELEPGNAIAIGGAGLLAWVLGRLDEAIVLHQQALEMDPLNPNLYHNYGLVLNCAGRREEASATLKKALELFPDMAGTHGMLGRVYLMQSNARGALAETEKEKHPVYRLWTLALAYHALERKKEDACRRLPRIPNGGNSEYRWSSASNARLRRWTPGLCLLRQPPIGACRRSSRTPNGDCFECRWVAASNARRYR
jgi:tetratricopeptide (TPR) repeat protein